MIAIVLAVLSMSAAAGLLAAFVTIKFDLDF